MKRCSKCGLVKCKSEFHNNKNRKDGLRSECKECRVRNAANYLDKYKE